MRHYLAAPLAPGPVTVRLDWARRFDHMQQHTGQHVLTAVAQERFGWETTAFHLGPERCDIELATGNILQAELDRLEEAVAEVIRAARLVTPGRVSMEAYRTMKVRSRGLPEGHTGDVRLVEIAGLDLNTCGGTHVRNTAELECLKLLGTEALRGGTRLFFVVGARARQRMEAQERRNAALRTLLGAPDEALVSPPSKPGWNSSGSPSGASAGWRRRCPRRWSRRSPAVPTSSWSATSTARMPGSSSGRPASSSRRFPGGWSS